MNNTEEYKKAKNESEPIFFAAVECEAARNNNSRFVKPCWANDYQDKAMHVDIFARDTIDKVVAQVDVKHVSTKNAATGKYSLSLDLEEYAKDLNNHWLAFRLTDGKQLIDKFLCVKSKYVFNDCTLETRKTQDGRSYKLVNIEEVKHKCREICELKLDYQI